MERKGSNLYWSPANKTEKNLNPLPRTFRAKMICGASALARNAKLKEQQDSAHTHTDTATAPPGESRDVGRGYPFQRFRFITIIFTLQACVFFLFFLFFFAPCAFCFLLFIGRVRVLCENDRLNWWGRD